MRRVARLDLVVLSVVLAVGASGCAERTLYYCASDSDCAALAPLDHCDVVQHACVAQEARYDLGGGDGDGGQGVDLLPTPDLLQGSRCTQAIECADPSAPICGASGQCEPCSSTLDDAICATHDAATPRCRTSGSGAGKCVACRSAAPNLESADCQAATPVCNTDGSCRTCRTHAECDSGFCDLGEGGQTGRCVPSSAVVHVDNRDLAIATCKTMWSTMQQGTMAEPYCDLDQAIHAVSTRSALYLKVTGRVATYGPVALSGITHGAVVVHGPGASAVPTAAITGGAVLVNVDTAGLKVVLEGMAIGNVSGSFACVSSNQAASVTLRDVVIDKCSAAGVRTVYPSGGTLVASQLTVKNVDGHGLEINTGGAQIDRAQILTNKQTGITLTGSGALIASTLVQGNGMGGLDVDALVQSGRIENSVLRGNGNSNGAKGPVSSFGGINSDGAFHIVNCTIDSNEATLNADPAGLRCIDGNTLALNTVLLGNLGAMSDVGAVCTLHGSAYVFATAATNGNVSLTGCSLGDVFVKPTTPADLHPRKDASDGCRLLDRGLASGGGATAPAIDFDGTMRPKGNGIDIGAYETVP